MKTTEAQPLPGGLGREEGLADARPGPRATCPAPSSSTRTTSFEAVAKLHRKATGPSRGLEGVLEQALAPPARARPAGNARRRGAGDATSTRSRSRCAGGTPTRIGHDIVGRPRSTGASPGRCPESAASRFRIARQRSSSERMRARVLDQDERPATPGKRADRPLELAGGDRDRGERRAELVGGARRERRHGGEPLVARGALPHLGHGRVAPLEGGGELHHEVRREDGRDGESHPHALEMQAEVGARGGRACPSDAAVQRRRGGRSSRPRAPRGTRSSGRPEHDRREGDVHEVEHAEGVVGPAAGIQERREQQGVEGQGALRRGCADPRAGAVRARARRCSRRTPRPARAAAQPEGRRRAPGPHLW